MSFKMDAQKRYFPKTTPSAARQALAAMREVPFPETRQCTSDQESEVDERSSPEREDINEGEAGDDCDDLIDSITTDKTNMPKGKFRLCNEKFLLTYKTHLDKPEVLNFFKNLRKSVDLDEVFVAHEKASSKTNYEHSHVFVSFKAAFTSSSQRVFDINGIHPNIKIISSKKHMQHIWQYLCKEDHSNDHLLSRITQETIFDKICSQKNLHDALRLAKTPSECSGIREMYSLRQISGIKFYEPKHTWQKELHTFLTTTPPSERKIIWVRGAHGGEGKTHFNKYMKHVHGALTMNELKKDADIAMRVGEAMDIGWDSKYACINLVRNYRFTDDLFTALEKFKDGEMTAVKYRGGDLYFPTPHLVVMSNDWPDVSTVSYDRWDIREVVQEGQHEDGTDDYVFSPKSYKEIQADIRKSKPFLAVKGDFNKILSDIARSKPDASQEEIIELVAQRLRVSYREWNPVDPTTTSFTGL